MGAGIPKKKKKKESALITAMANIHPQKSAPTDLIADLLICNKIICKAL